ncbi:hypothetical protein [Streptomyces sp. NPDC048411]|uniref:hypothetical protein n=1 Tax=Streptomyces sp. NPDC048411 TaxID=3157206 RepID=UPI00345315C2
MYGGDRKGAPEASRSVALPAIDGREYVHRVHALRDALPANPFRAAFHCHADGLHPRIADRLDAAPIRHTERIQQI